MSHSLLQPETGIWYGVCWIVIIIRLISRRMHRKAWKFLQLDDYLIVVAMATATVGFVVMHKIVKTSSNLIPEGQDVSKFSEQEISSRIYGSKLVLVAEQMQIVTIWLIKTCLLIMYNRMTVVLPQHKFVQATAVYVLIGFIVMEVLYFGVWCRPFNQYWAVPTYSIQCSAATHHLITNAVFNISSDLIIISIPLPLLFRVRLPKKNKTILLGIFLIGAFTIVAAILNKYYSFTHPFGTEWTLWYLREIFTALLCANLPLTYPLIQRVFGLKNWSQNSYTADTTYEQDPQAQPTKKSRWATRKALFKFKGLRPGTEVKGTESQENINYSFNREGEDGSRFITSAIALEDMKPEGVSSDNGPSTCQTSHINGQNFTSGCAA